jgi:hypothetical protein
VDGLPSLPKHCLRVADAQRRFRFNHGRQPGWAEF